MSTLTEERVSCPYCGESLQVLIEVEGAEQQYIEDCQVCCRPITFAVSTGMDGNLQVSVYDENDVF